MCRLFVPCPNCLVRAYQWYLVILHLKYSSTYPKYLRFVWSNRQVLPPCRHGLRRGLAVYYRRPCCRRLVRWYHPRSFLHLLPLVLPHPLPRLFGLVPRTFKNMSVERLQKLYGYFKSFNFDVDHLDKVKRVTQFIVEK